jgi:hypothetical protein
VLELGGGHKKEQGGGRGDRAATPELSGCAHQCGSRAKEREREGGHVPSEEEGVMPTGRPCRLQGGRGWRLGVDRR